MIACELIQVFPVYTLDSLMDIPIDQFQLLIARGKVQRGEITTVEEYEAYREQAPIIRAQMLNRILGHMTRR